MIIYQKFQNMAGKASKQDADDFKTHHVGGGLSLLFFKTQGKRAMQEDNYTFQPRDEVSGKIINTIVFLAAIVELMYKIRPI